MIGSITQGQRVAGGVEDRQVRITRRLWFFGIVGALLGPVKLARLHVPVDYDGYWYSVASKSHAS
jgi:hypothetical protein